MLQKDDENQLAKIGEMKIIKLLKNEPRVIYFKRSYSEEEYKKAVVIKRRREIDVIVSKAYEDKPGISERKTDLMELVEKNLIPRYYRSFFEAL
ncbi:unnamed protein product [Parnassius apollo]|uniref:(apollo) hypothetical protein n=1 Tax=Parnassius apollo TaxID=110799 RepID=A0A8S3XXB4_PARAO|nr:unnamed protein product [Parnassius apollo]